MKVLALVEDPGGACYRYRWNAHAWALAEAGLQLEAMAWDKSTSGKSWQRIQALIAAAQADMVVLQRRLLPAWQLALLRRAARVLVYDFDDALFRRDSYCGKAQCSGRRLTRFAATLRAADGVIAGNDYLRQFASAQTDRRRVYYVPTCVEPDWYPHAEHKNTGAAARFAWIGQRSMLPSLQSAYPHLLAAANQLGKLRLDVICDAKPMLPGIDVDLIPWSSADETTHLAAADIGVSWLPNDLWSLGKCGLKVLQYMAAGLPVIANPVGIHRELVEHGVTGFLAETPRQWAEAAVKLADNPALRQRLGKNARARVRAAYSAKPWGARLANILVDILKNRGDMGFQPICEKQHGQDARATAESRPSLAEEPGGAYNQTRLPGTSAW